MLKDVANEINKKGYEAETCMVNKNGIEMEGLVIKTGDVNPVFYWEDKYNSMTVKEIADKLVKYVRDMKENININIKDLTSYNNICKSICFCVRQRGINDGAFTFPVLDLDGYFRLRIDMNDDSVATSVVKKELLDRFETSVDTFIEIAKQNTFKRCSNDIPFMPGLTDISGNYGAGNIINLLKLNDICNERGVERLFLLPSSIHELLLFPCDDINEYESLSDLVKEVNKNCVKPEEILSDHAYIYDKATNRVVVRKEDL